jgi:hypothetical protein
VLIVLAALGVALVALGVLILLRFPDRPGGNVSLMGLEVSSVGAGLPLVALGVLVTLVAFTQSGEDGPSSTSDESSSSGGGGAVVALLPKHLPACFADFFAADPAVPRDRRRPLPSEAQDIAVLRADEAKADEFALVFTDRQEVVGAAKLRYDVDAKQTSIDAVVDASCKPVSWISNVTPGPSPDLVDQYTTLRLELGTRTYEWELKPEGEYQTELRRFQS